MDMHFDVLIIGAGISGIGSAHHLKDQMPGKTFAVLEAHATFGGTWHIHQYPGIRSDSDLYTFGYRFKPWTGAPIASGAEIMRYLKDVIATSGLAPHIRYGKTVRSASWRSDERLWEVEVDCAASGARETYTTAFLWMCTGYYRHDSGFQPDWPGRQDFAGEIIHPQAWPEDIHLADKEVVVIGSGATAATLVPALAGACAKLTMLQRSPTYFYIGSNRNKLADTLRQLDIEPAWIHEIVRRKILHDQRILTELALAYPDLAKAQLLQGVKEQVGDAVDVATHFTPRYRPWEQRIAFVPDGDLFKAVKAGKVEIVTDHIDRILPDGLLLNSGRRLMADVMITATGFNLSVLGDIRIEIDGEALDLANCVTWRGMMLTQVPNLVWTFGYFRASWTLRVDLIADFVCKLLKYMDQSNYRFVAPDMSMQGDAGTPRVWSEGSQFAPGYIQRGEALLPKRASAPEWTHTQDYWTEKEELPRLQLESSPLRFAH